MGTVPKKVPCVVPILGGILAGFFAYRRGYKRSESVYSSNVNDLNSEVISGEFPAQRAERFVKTGDCSR